jgi:hypothetical protein
MEGPLGSGDAGIPSIASLDRFLRTFHGLESRDICAARKVDPPPRMNAFVAVIFAQLLPKPPRLYANHGLHLGIVARDAVENVDAYRRLFEARRAAIQLDVNNVRQKLP